MHFAFAARQASKGKPAVIRQLLAAKAAVNATDSTGSTPLHRAASAGGRWVWGRVGEGYASEGWRRRLGRIACTALCGRAVVPASITVWVLA